MDPRTRLRENARIYMKRFVVFLLMGVAALATGQTAAFVVGEKAAGSIGFYDAEFHRIGGAKVGTHPHEIALSPDRKTLYVADNGVMWMTETGAGDNTVSIVDIASMKRTATIDLGQFRRPHGIYYDARSNHVYVTTEKPVSYTHLRAHETGRNLVCRLLLEKKK